jgi:predicted amidohydrolase YtcJ
MGVEAVLVRAFSEAEAYRQQWAEYEAALKAVPTVDHRFRIEHVQVLDHADVPRFAQRPD